MRKLLGPRGGIWVAIIIAVAVALGLLETSWPAIAAGIFSTWLAIAILEIWLSSRERQAAARAEPVATRPREEGPVAVEPEAEPAPEPVAADAAPEPEPEPVAAEAAPEPEPEQEPAALTPPPPPVLTALPPATPADEPEPQAEPATADTAPARADVVELQPPVEREWNLWELERIARERAGDDPVRDEEWSFLLMYLRDFASPDGVLPRDFDQLVRETFGEALQVAR